MGDIDGGVYTNDLTTPVPDGLTSANFNSGFEDVLTFPGAIGFSAVTQDNLDDLEQFTQEIRFASETDDALSWQTGAFYYDSSFNVTSIDGYFGATTVFHENTTWAVFGQTTYEVNERLNVTGGIRYTYDEKSLRVGEQNVNGFALVTGDASVQDYEDIDVDDGQIDRKSVV